jgi:hypothetical protein
MPAKGGFVHGDGVAIEQPLVALATLAAIGQPCPRQAVDRATGGTDDVH